MQNSLSSPPPPYKDTLPHIGTTHTRCFSLQRILFYVARLVLSLALTNAIVFVAQISIFTTVSLSVWYFSIVRVSDFCIDTSLSHSAVACLAANSYTQAQQLSQNLHVFRRCCDHFTVRAFHTRLVINSRLARSLAQKAMPRIYILHATQCDQGPILWRFVCVNFTLRYI